MLYADKPYTVQDFHHTGMLNAIPLRMSVILYIYDDLKLITRDAICYMLYAEINPYTVTSI